MWVMSARREMAAYYQLYNKALVIVDDILLSKPAVRNMLQAFVLCFWSLW